jgi:hypothetical protein
MGNINSQCRTNHEPIFHPKVNAPMGVKTASKSKESVTPSPKNPKKQKFVVTMMTDVFNPDMICFHTQLNVEDEFEAIQMRPYSWNPSWLKKKILSLTKSDWYTASCGYLEYFPSELECLESFDQQL